MNPREEARARLTAIADQLTSALTEDSAVEAISTFQKAVFELDDMLEGLGIDRPTRMNAIAGGTARCLLERYGQA